MNQRGRVILLFSIAALDLGAFVTLIALDKLTGSFLAIFVAWSVSFSRIPPNLVNNFDFCRNSIDLTLLAVALRPILRWVYHLESSLHFDLALLNLYWPIFCWLELLKITLVRTWARLLAFSVTNFSLHPHDRCNERLFINFLSSGNSQHALFRHFLFYYLLHILQNYSISVVFLLESRDILWGLPVATFGVTVSQKWRLSLQAKEKVVVLRVLVGNIAAILDIDPVLVSFRAPEGRNRGFDIERMTRNVLQWVDWEYFKNLGPCFDEIRSRTRLVMQQAKDKINQLLGVNI